MALKPFTFFIWSIFLLGVKKSEKVEKNDNFRSLNSFTSFSAIALPFDAATSSGFELIEEL